MLVYQRVDGMKLFNSSRWLETLNPEKTKNHSVGPIAEGIPGIHPCKNRLPTEWL
jgi:hypothetical protein